MPFGRLARARHRRRAATTRRPRESTRVPIESRRRRGPAGARRARALARRLLRLDARARARARRAGVAEAAQGAGAAGRAAVARRARPSRSSSRTQQRAAVARIVDGDRRGRRERSCSTARPARARPRSTCRRARRRSSAGSARSCSCRRSRSRRRRSAACAQRFGDRVAILHSALTEAERRDERERIASGEARIVVGARSAVFAPVRGLGLIVVDEEHDAVVQAGLRPALRRAHGRREARGARGRGRRLRLGDAAARELGGARAARARRPGRRRSCRRCRSSTCGARRATRSRRRCSTRCAASPSGGGKAILLLNRRGVAPALHCRACGTTIRCPNCDVALVLHGDASLRCHHCGTRRAAPSNCPACGSPELARLGAGTQKLERELARELPELELIRLDADAVAKPEQLADVAAPLRRGRRARCCSARRWSRRATTSRASSSPR